MNKKLMKMELIMMFLFLFCRISFGEIVLDTIAKFVPGNKNTLQEAIISYTEYQFNNVLNYVVYDPNDINTTIPLLRNPNFEQVTVFSFLGYPVSVDSIVESIDTIKIYYKLPDYRGIMWDQSSRLPPRDIDEVKICTMPKTTKNLTFIHNFSPPTIILLFPLKPPCVKLPRLVSVRGRTLSVNIGGNSQVRVRVMTLTGKTATSFNTMGNAKLSLKGIPSGAYIIEAKRAVDGRRVTSSAVLR